MRIVNVCIERNCTKSSGELRREKRNLSEQLIKTRNFFYQIVSEAHSHTLGLSASCVGFHLQ